LKTPSRHTQPPLPDELRRVAEARHHDPFTVLGRHAEDERVRVRVFLPDAEWVRLEDSGLDLQRREGSDFFEALADPDQVPERYRLRRGRKDGSEALDFDPYAFPPQVGDFDLHLFGEGRHWHCYRVLGAHRHSAEGIAGVRFVVWAPNAERVSVVGDFNRWDGRVHAMRSRGGGGVWELFIPGLDSGVLYKYEIRNRERGSIHVKTDPYGQEFEYRPGTAPRVTGPSRHAWGDQDWLERRRHSDWLHQPLSIYELHLGSWQRGEHNEFLNYRVLAERIVTHVKSLGFTHIELLPVTEHPLDASWGYQTTGYFAPTSRFGTPDDFRYFVDHCHRHNIGIILDWAPGHFPKDDHALANFDGSPLYEHADPRMGEHREWGTLVFNYGRNEVKNFLLSSAVYWLEEFHIDGLRVDAVASMLYLDYSREAGDWVPNIHGGRENLEAIDFLREMNEVTHGQHPGTLVIAEESTAWPQVTRPTYVGGLGFSMKWNMGWMHDTLLYMSKDPVHRTYQHDSLTFGLLYAFTENFVLPFSHDEVVHGKGSLLGKMPGDDWQRFANLRLLYSYQFTYPGKKLLFMGSEFAQSGEWNFDSALPWNLLQYAPHQGVRTLIQDLNRLYREFPALHSHDFEGAGFEWIDCHDASQSVISYLRKAGQQTLVVILNFTPVPRPGYRLGVPEAGQYRVLLNSDSSYYGGSNSGIGEPLRTTDEAWMGRPHSLSLSLPPLGAVILVRD
jgi:1,4-alpha-glucan branching enzyme